jgi:hypothetical protein
MSDILARARDAAEGLVRCESPVGLPGFVDIAQDRWISLTAQLVMLQTAIADATGATASLMERSDELLRLGLMLAGAEQRASLARATGEQDTVREGAALLEAGSLLFAEECQNISSVANLLKDLATRIAADASGLIAVDSSIGPAVHRSLDH